jgi:hypothetical protein
LGNYFVRLLLPKNIMIIRLFLIFVGVFLFRMWETTIALVDLHSDILVFGRTSLGVVDSVWFLMEFYLKSLKMVSHLAITCVKFQN